MPGVAAMVRNKAEPTWGDDADPALWGGFKKAVIKYFQRAELSWTIPEIQAKHMTLAPTEQADFMRQWNQAQALLEDAVSEVGADQLKLVISGMARGELMGVDRGVAHVLRGGTESPSPRWQAAAAGREAADRVRIERAPQALPGRGGGPDGDCPLADDHWGACITGWGSATPASTADEAAQREVSARLAALRRKISKSRITGWGLGLAGNASFTAKEQGGLVESIW